MNETTFKEFLEHVGSIIQKQKKLTGGYTEIIVN